MLAGLLLPLIHYRLIRRNSGAAAPANPLPMSVDERRQRMIQIKAAKQRAKKRAEDLKAPIILTPEDFDETLPPLPVEFPVRQPDPEIRFKQARNRFAKKFDAGLRVELARQDLLDSITKAARETVFEKAKPDEALLRKARNEKQQKLAKQRAIEAQKVAEEIKELERQLEELEGQERELEETVRQQEQEAQEKRNRIEEQRDALQRKVQAKAVQAATRVRRDKDRKRRLKLERQRLEQRKKLRAARRKVAFIRRKQQQDDEEAVLMMIMLNGD